MSLSLGNTNIGELYVGSNKIAKAYLGSNLVYQASAPGPTPSFDEVTIGTQTWMSKNLAIDDGGEGITIIDNVTSEGVNFGTQYYYTFDAAVRVAASIEGWHLPSQAEFETLKSYLGNDSGYKLKSTSGWYDNANGSDEYGFNGLPTGLSNGLPGKNCVIWSSTPSGKYIYAGNLSFNSNDLSYQNIRKTYLIPVRLIKNT